MLSQPLRNRFGIHFRFEEYTNENLKEILLNFCEKNKFTIPLISDTKSDLLKQFKALGPLGKYGNGDDVTDIIRSTFIIDSKGTPVYAFRDVQAIGHAQRILDLISQ